MVAATATAEAAAVATDWREAVASATGDRFALTGGLGFLRGGTCAMLVTSYMLA